MPRKEKKLKKKKKAKQNKKKEDFLSVLYWEHFHVQKGPETKLPTEIPSENLRRNEVLAHCTAPGLNQFSSSGERKLRKEIRRNQAQNSARRCLVPRFLPSLPNTPAALWKPCFKAVAQSSRREFSGVLPHLLAGARSDTRAPRENRLGSRWSQTSAPDFTTWGKEIKLSTF